MLFQRTVYWVRRSTWPGLLQRLDQVLFNETSLGLSFLRCLKMPMRLQWLAQRYLPAHRLGTVGGNELASDGGQRAGLFGNSRGLV
jgi:hypothetical protein